MNPRGRIPQGAIRLALLIHPEAVPGKQDIGIKTPGHLGPLRRTNLDRCGILSKQIPGPCNS
jgi:hypothetical protein